MVKHRLSVKHYPSQHYSTIFNPKTGFFARIEDRGCSEPQWAQIGPELLDIAVTNWCDRECATCYRCSNKRGYHMPIKIYLTILKQAAKIGVMQVALGGGNPNQHPLFSDILRATRDDYGIVPSFTTNGRGLTSQIIEASRKYCGAVAVTAHEPYSEMQLAIRRLVASGIKTNIHFVLNKNSVDTAISWLKNPPKALDGINAIVFLNYKPVGRISDVEVVLRYSHRVREFFKLACSSIIPFRVGFDSCLVSGLVTYVNVNSVWFDACEAARFSMFISERAIAFPCSFMEPDFKGIPVKENNLQQIWQKSLLFRWFRNAILKPHCQSCSKTNICMGGCPLFSEVNLCNIRHPDYKRN